MSYNRILTPRFYLDTNNWRMARGSDNKLSKISGTFNTGSTIDDLIDMKPLNRCSFDTSGNTTHIILQLDSLTTSIHSKFDYIAILNHNLDTADGRVGVMYQIESGTTTTTFQNKLIESGQNFESTVSIGDRVINTTDSSLAYVTNIDSDTQLTLNNDIMITGEDYKIFTPVTGLTEVVNGTIDNDGGSGSRDVADPAVNGSTILTFDEITGDDGRYWAIEIEDDDTFSGTDLEIGLIMMGEYYDMPHSSDRAVKRTIDYDGVTIQQAIGGGEFANASHFGGDDFSSSYFGQPFRQGSTSYIRRAGGRISYDIKFSYLNDTDLMPSNLAYPYGDTVFHDVWNKASGMYIPFIFGTDKTSTTMGDYIFARFQGDSLQATQVANQVWDISLKIKETW